MPRPRSNLAKAVPVAVYRESLFDDSNLAYLMDLYEAVERLKTKRNLAFADGDTAKAEEYEALRNEHITSLAKLLKDMRK
jgi:DNA-binding phage protein